MPTIVDDAVCVRHWDFSETSQTVSLFGREHGMLRGLAKGSRRPHGRFSGGIDLLARGQVVAIVKSGRELATLTDWHLLDAHWPLRRSLAANRVAFYAADLVHHTISAGDPHPNAFDGLVECLRDLGESDRIAASLLRFQWVMLQETGYRPRLDEDAETGGPLPDGATLAFSAGAGGIVADNGANDRWRVRRETVDLLRQIARDAPIETVAAAPEVVVDRANRLLAVYVRELLGRELPTVPWVFPELAGR